MLDLALSGSELHATAGLFLVAPDARESEVRAQLARPAFSRIADLEIAYLPYGELERHKEAISRFGSGLKRSEEHTSELQSLMRNIVCRLLLEKKNILKLPAPLSHTLNTMLSHNHSYVI